MAKRRLINAHYLAPTGEFWGLTSDTEAVRINIEDGGQPVQIAAKDVPEERREALLLRGLRAELDNVATTAGGDIGAKRKAMESYLKDVMDPDGPGFPKPRVVGGAGSSGGPAKTDEVLARTELFETPEEAFEWRQALRDGMEQKDYNAKIAEVKATPEYKEALREYEAENAKADAPRLASLIQK